MTALQGQPPRRTRDHVWQHCLLISKRSCSAYSEVSGQDSRNEKLKTCASQQYSDVEILMTQAVYITLSAERLQ